MALQVKLDELIIAHARRAATTMAGAEDMCDEDLEALHEDLSQARRAGARHRWKSAAHARR